MPHGGTLTIETTQTELAKSPLYHADPLPPGHYMKLSVTDTGSGMDRNTQAHIFEPFFTTKEEGKGSGLGLSTVFGIVTQSGGGIDVNSRVGYGTKFDIFFPRVAADAQAASARRAGEQPIGGTETILLVEDDASVRILLRDSLRKLGYRVIEAKHGIEACLMASQELAKPASAAHRYGDARDGRKGTCPTLDDHETGSPRALHVRLYRRRRHPGRSRTRHQRVPAKPFTPELLARTVRKI